LRELPAPFGVPDILGLQFAPRLGGFAAMLGFGHGAMGCDAIEVPMRPVLVNTDYYAGFTNLCRFCGNAPIRTLLSRNHTLLDDLLKPSEDPKDNE